MKASVYAASWFEIDEITNYKLQNPNTAQRGYMLITLMLALALITIAMLAVLPEMKQQINRDREEEMRHRGTAYMRAIQHFYKKFGRYPTRVEELENTNNLRFLRKRYKDPMNPDPVTGKERDFKFLHQTDISLNNGPVLGQTPGQNVLGGQGGLSGQGGLGTQGGLGGLQGGLGGAGSTAGRLSADRQCGRADFREWRFRQSFRCGGEFEFGRLVVFEFRSQVPIPVPASTGRRSAEDRFSGSPA